MWLGLALEEEELQRCTTASSESQSFHRLTGG